MSVLRSDVVYRLPRHTMDAMLRLQDLQLAVEADTSLTVVECSAVTGEGLPDVVAWLLAL